MFNEIFTNNNTIMKDTKLVKAYLNENEYESVDLNLILMNIFKLIVKINQILF